MAFVRLVCLRPRLGALYKFRRHTYFGRTLHFNTLGNIQDICHRATTGRPAYAHTHIHARSNALTHRQTSTSLHETLTSLSVEPFLLRVLERNFGRLKKGLCRLHWSSSSLDRRVWHTSRQWRKPGAEFGGTDKFFADQDDVPPVPLGYRPTAWPH